MGKLAYIAITLDGAKAKLEEFIPWKLDLLLLWSGDMLAVAGLGWSGSLKRVLRKKAARIEAISGDNFLLVSFWDWKQIT